MIPLNFETSPTVKIVKEAQLVNFSTTVADRRRLNYNNYSCMETMLDQNNLNSLNVNVETSVHRVN